eukprot:s2095_g26.t1
MQSARRERSSLKIRSISFIAVAGHKWPSCSQPSSCLASTLCCEVAKRIALAACMLHGTCFWEVEGA